jgi:hypothetical protein
MHDIIIIIIIIIITTKRVKVSQKSEMNHQEKTLKYWITGWK